MAIDAGPQQLRLHVKGSSSPFIFYSALQADTPESPPHISVSLH